MSWLTASRRLDIVNGLLGIAVCCNGENNLTFGLAFFQEGLLGLFFYAYR